MRNLSYFSILGFALGCGAEDRQLIKSFSYDVTEQRVELGLEFQKELELNTDLIVPIKDYGEIKLLAPYGTKGLQITGSLNLDMFLDPDFIHMERTRFLPNGGSMSSYVETNLARIRFQPHDSIGTSLYLGVDDTSKRYLGTSIELGFIDQNFPQGLIISQRLNDSMNRPLGVITFYGPKVENGRLIAPGGLFFVTNLTDLHAYKKDPSTLNDHRLIPDTKTEINDPYKKMLSDPRKIQNLLDLYERSGKKAQLID
jgi:hypothetical protein